jgi:hypothetical protein
MVGRRGDVSQDPPLDGGDVAEEAGEDASLDSPVEVGEDGAADALDAGDDADASAACATEIAALSEEMYEELGVCAAVVRLDYEGYDILGFQLFCGPWDITTEGAAAVTAETDTGFGQGGGIERISAADAEDFFVFYESPGDFGGASAVSRRSGLTAFGGSIVWDGNG